MIQILHLKLLKDCGYLGVDYGWVVVGAFKQGPDLWTYHVTIHGHGQCPSSGPITSRSIVTLRVL